MRPAGGWSLLIDVVAMGSTPAEASAAMLRAGVAATGMTGWGGDVAARYVRFVFSAEPVSRLATLGRAPRGERSAVANGRQSAFLATRVA